MDIGSIFEGLTSGVAGGLLGGITGLAGSVATAVMAYKQQKLKNTHDIDMTTLEQAGMQLEADLAIKQAEVTATIEEGKNEMEAFKASMEGVNVQSFDSSYMQYLHPFVRGVVAFMLATVDFTKGTIRPVLTYWFIYKTSWLLDKAVKANPNFAKQNADLLIFTYVYLMTTCVTWWFADRRMAKFLMRLHDGNRK